MAETTKTSSPPTTSESATPQATVRARRVKPASNARDWRTVAARWWRPVRQWMNREHLIEFAKTMALVAPLTVLIWIYAEREQTDQDDGVVFPIEVRSSGLNRVVTLHVPSDKNVVADLSGPRARLDRVREQLIPRADMPPLTIDIDASLTPGQTHDFNTAALLSNQPEFANAGITVTSASPPRLTVYVDEIVRIEARIEAPASITNLESPPVFDPPVVTIIGPHSELTREFPTSPTDDKPVVYADFSGVTALKTPGETTVKDVPLQMPDTESTITFSPPRVSATLSVKQTNVAFEYDSMPIFKTTPLGNFDELYEVELIDPASGILYDVPLVGPPEMKEMLERPDYTPRPKANLEISASDLPPGEQRTRRVEFDNLPEGVEVAPSFTQREVTFRLVERRRPE